MIPLNEGDLYLVHELDVDYDFNSDQYFIAKLRQEEVDAILLRNKRGRGTADLEIVLIRDMEVSDFKTTCDKLGMENVKLSQNR